jgi:predicted RNA-binding protein YlxR (DUF448 family)
VAVKGRHRPQRTCLGCGMREEKSKLIRIVASGQGDLRIDALAAGRGGYLHESEACRRSFLRRKSLYRAFHSEIGVQAREKLVRDLAE